jgi:hypothetical protein
LITAIAQFGISPEALDQNTFSEQGRIVRIGSPPMMVEFINSVSGITFAEAWEHRVEGIYGDVEVFFISRSDLLKNKIASGRPQDLRDVDELGHSDN